MGKWKVLVVGKNNAGITSLIQQLKAAVNLQAEGVAGAEMAIEQFQRMHYDVVVIATDILEEASKLQRIFLFQQPELLLLIEHPEMLEKLQHALQHSTKNSTGSFTVIDDALQGAMLPINIQ